jgi:hypothetical protein
VSINHEKYLYALQENANLMAAFGRHKVGKTAKK